VKHMRERDSYGLPVTEKRRRLPGCTDPHPCRSFRCQHPLHPGARDTPWCRGGTRDEIDTRGVWCDDCWAKEFLAARAPVSP